MISVIAFYYSKDVPHMIFNIDILSLSVWQTALYTVINIELGKHPPNHRLI